jgi:hypothetical protein
VTAVKARPPAYRTDRRDLVIAGLREELAAERANVDYINESIGDLERGLFEPGYQRLTTQSQIEFSDRGLIQLRAICRLFAVKNPLIKRGLALRAAYVWGQGVEITARANGKNGGGEQDVQAVISDFLTSDANQRAATGSSAQARLETALGTDGEVYFAAVTRPMTGQVQLRVLLADEIAEIYTNPDDRSEPWYYLRRWEQRTLNNVDGIVQSEPMVRYYPAIGYRPAGRPRVINGHPVQWDTPLLHVKVNNPEGWLRGIPDAYAAVDWAKAYKEFLEDWARLMRSLSRFAWKATTPGNKAAAIKTRLAQAPTRALNGEPNSAGATAILPPDVALEAISKSGATIDSESGRPLAMMTASALGVPVTMLLSDPGQTGARATAETLDQPTELEMQLRREVWTEAYRTLLRYAVTESVRAPQGTLKGTIKRDPFTGQETVQLAGDTDDSIDVVWPALDQATPDVMIGAIAKAASVGVIPPEQIARLLLQALGVRDVDAILDDLTDADGNFIYPKPPALTPAGGPAALLRAGGNPADAMPGGSMQPDGAGAGDGGQPTDALPNAPAPDTSRGGG